MNSSQKYIKHPDADSFDEQGEYVNKCSCGREHHLFTQSDEHPEYVLVLCSCGKNVTFELPVN